MVSVFYLANNRNIECTINAWLTLEVLDTYPGEKARHALENGDPVVPVEEIASVDISIKRLRASDDLPLTDDLAYLQVLR